jgi:hypothetical protein
MINLILDIIDVLFGKKDDLPKVSITLTKYTY